RFNSTVLPPSSSLTITPPVSQHGSGDSFTPTKGIILPEQDTPIDLSASSSTSNIDMVRVKRETLSSDLEDDDNIASDPEMNNSDEDLKFRKSAYYE
ncbi:unnamed protein product, partial [Allacma fusca]